MWVSFTSRPFVYVSSGCDAEEGLLSKTRYSLLSCKRTHMNDIALSPASCLRLLCFTSYSNSVSFFNNYLSRVWIRMEMNLTWHARVPTHTHAREQCAVCLLNKCEWHLNRILFITIQFIKWVASSLIKWLFLEKSSKITSYWIRKIQILSSA